MKSRLFVFDTNALISAFLVKNSSSERALRKAMAEGGLAVSNSLMSEFLEVLWRTKFDKYFSPDERMEVLEEIDKYAIPFTATEKITDSIDPDDNMILELAVASQSSCIITGNKKHLLTLHPFRGIPILSPADFLKMF